MEKTRTTTPALRTLTRLSPGGTIVRLSPFELNALPVGLDDGFSPRWHQHHVLIWVVALEDCVIRCLADHGHEIGGRVIQ